MSKRIKWTTNKINVIHNHIKNGMSQREIAKIMKLSQTSISRISKKIQELNPVVDKSLDFSSITDTNVNFKPILIEKKDLFLKKRKIGRPKKNQIPDQLPSNSEILDIEKLIGKSKKTQIPEQIDEKRKPGRPKKTQIPEQGGGLGKWVNYDKNHLINLESGMIVLKGTNLNNIKEKDIKGIDRLLVGEKRKPGRPKKTQIPEQIDEKISKSLSKKTEINDIKDLFKDFFGDAIDRARNDNATMTNEKRLNNMSPIQERLEAANNLLQEIAKMSWFQRKDCDKLIKGYFDNYGI